VHALELAARTKARRPLAGNEHEDRAKTLIKTINRAWF